MRRILTLLFILLPAALMAQSNTHLEFESSGPRIGWIASQPGAPPDNASKWDGKSFDLDTSAATAGSLLYVLDTSSGNLATKKASGAAKGWLVKDSDFKLVAHLKVRVEHEGKPVQVADVVVNDGSKPQNGLVDADSNGTADFFAVKPGNVGVEVSYHSKGETKSQKQSFNVDLKRDTAVPLLVVSITGDVATASAAPAAGGATSPAAQPSAGESQPISGRPPTATQKKVGDFAATLLGILFAVAVLWGGWMLLQKYQGNAQGALQKVGLSLHEPSPFDPTTSTPIHAATTPAPPAPQQQILLSGATPTPLTAAAAPSAGAPTASTPHFTKENGEVIHLAEGTSRLGRDADTQLSFPAETSLSRHHAEITRTGPQVVVRDLGSTNGTFVNGVKIVGDSTLRPGDTVQFGMMRIRFEG